MGDHPFVMAQAAEAAFDAKKYVTEAIAESAGVMISKSYCPYCTKAKGVIGKYTKNMIVKEIDQLSQAQTEAIQVYTKELTGGRSVPRVFIGGEFVGGCDDTVALDKAGKLKTQIEAAEKK